MNQKTKTNEDAKRQEALDLIKDLLDTYSTGGYVFRGVNEEYSKHENDGIQDGINSTLYRKVMENDEGKALKKTLEKNDMLFFPAFIEKKMVEDAQRYFPSNTSNLEILTDLQHFGGATNMIDFSHSIYVALFFACQGSTEKDGEFIALSLDLEEAKEINEVDYTAPPQEGALEIIAPAHSQHSKYRVNFQGSIFVRPAEGYIPYGKYKVETVSKDLKKYLLQCIKNACGVSSKNIYNDFHGVITTQEDFLKRSTFSYMAVAHYFSGNYGESISCHDKSISINPDESHTDYNERGVSYATSRQHERAIEDFNKAILINPNYAEAYSNRGDAHNSLKQHKRAIEDLNKSISLKPHLEAAHNNRGNAYHGLGQYELAIENYNKAVSLNPNLAETYNNRGYSYDSLGQYDRAIQDYDKAISLKSNFIEAYFNRGMSCNKSGKYERAIKDFDKVISVTPNSVEAYNNRGNAYTHLGQYQRAIEDFNKAILLKPDFAEAYNNRGNAYGFLKQYQNAIENFEKAISLNPDLPIFYFNRGVAHSNLGQHELAIENYNKAILLDPDFYQAYYNRGVAYRNLKQSERAIEDFDKTIKINPNYAKAYYSRGLAKGAMGKVNEAKADFIKASELGMAVPEDLLPPKK